ncbi:MAG: Rpn family recombination-promoting nuclease/putative transposase [Caldilineaceae bacterium]
MTVHDSGYKRLFSNRTIFRQLIQTFVEEDWVAELDFDRAERLDKSFVADHYKETESDLIYKVPYRHAEKVIYLYILIEFQSNVQRFMVLRTLNYITSFYLDYVHATKDVKQLKLPVIFPIVLYNGEEKWTAPNNIAELIEDAPALGKYSLNFEHFVIAENQYGKEALLAIRNIVSTLFLAEAHYDLPLLVEQLLAIFDEEDDKQALSLFLNWFRQLAARGYIPPNDFAQIEQEYRTKEEVTSMLIKALEREREAIRQQAVEATKKEWEGERETIRQRAIEETTRAKNRQIVRAMAEKGFALTLIAEVTQLSLEEVERLLAEEPSPNR